MHFNFNENIEGYYHNNKLHEFETGDELLTLWFRLLIKVIVTLENQSKYVALKEIETFDSWLEFILQDDDNLKVSYIKNPYNSTSAIVTSKIENSIYPTWRDEVISFAEFKSKVKIYPFIVKS